MLWSSWGCDKSAKSVTSAIALLKVLKEKKFGVLKNAKIGEFLIISKPIVLFLLFHWG